MDVGGDFGPGGEDPAKIKATKKRGIRQTRVHFRYHRPDEYSKLTPPQRKELQEWRSAQPVTAPHPGSKKKARRDAAISAAVAKQVAVELAKSQTKDVAWRPPSDEEGGTSKAAIKAFLVSAFNDDRKPAAKAIVASSEIPVQVQVPPEKPHITLSSILKQAKNESKK